MLHQRDTQSSCTHSRTSLRSFRLIRLNDYPHRKHEIFIIFLLYYYKTKRTPRAHSTQLTTIMNFVHSVRLDWALISSDRTLRVTNIINVPYSIGPAMLHKLQHNLQAIKHTFSTTTKNRTYTQHTLRTHY